MDKLGVQFDDEKVKTAGSKKINTCPDCGRELIENNQFLVCCLHCGTKPFEKKPETK